MFELTEIPNKGDVFFRKTTCGRRVAGSRYRTKYGMSPWTVWVQDGDVIHEGCFTNTNTVEVKYSIDFPEGKDLPMNRFLFGGPLMMDFIKAKDRYFASLGNP